MSRRYLCRRLCTLVYRQWCKSAIHCTQVNHNICICLPARFCTADRLSANQHIAPESLTRNSISTTFTDRTHLCGTVNLTHKGQEVTLLGWVDRVSGYFLKVYDWTGLVQIILNDEWLKKLSDLEKESVIKITGIVDARPTGQENKAMATGDIEIIPDNIQILNFCKHEKPLEPRSHQQFKGPDGWSWIPNINCNLLVITNCQNAFIIFALQITEKVRSQYRYLDIRSTHMQHNLRLRSAIIMKMREFLCNHHGFVDVETPTLFRRTPGGAKEFIVPSKYPGKFYSLPQSPQQFKQLLMVGGIDRYFQVARCYRDETSNPERQPEFTQLDIEMSFASQRHIRRLIEGLLNYCWPALQLGNIEANFTEMTYAEAMRDYGSDKPDIRFGMKLLDITEICKNCGNHFLKGAKTVLAIKIPEGVKHFSRKEIDRLLTSPLEEEQVKMLSVKLKDGGEWQSSVGNKMTDASKTEINNRLQAASSDLIVLAVGDGESTNKVLGRLRLDCAAQLEEKGIELNRDGVYKFLWIVDFPLFLPKKDCVESAHHPFTAPHEDDASLVYSQPDIFKVRSQHYDLVLNGNEIGGGSVRIHDAKLQTYILEHVLKEDPKELKHLLDALQYGCPPHAGIALGLDRLVAIMCGTRSIRDVIAFPKFADKDPMSKAPVELTKEELASYHLQIIKS